MFLTWMEVLETKKNEWIFGIVLLTKLWHRGKISKQGEIRCFILQMAAFGAIVNTNISL